MANVLVQDTSLTAIADAIRAKNGSATLYKPSEMAAAITALPTGTGSAIDFITNTTKYDCVVYEPSTNTSSAASVVLPDGVAFEDIKFIIGIGGRNSGATGYNDSDHNIFIYCPDLYNYSLEESDTGKQYWACMGSIVGSYSTSTLQGIDYGRDYRIVSRGATQNNYFGWITYDSANHALQFYVSQFHSTEPVSSQFTQGRIIAQYGRVAVIYDKGV